jgi:hypothetical protein
VAADGTDIGTVAGISSEVTTVSGISANVTTVAGISANVTTVAGISANVTTVAGDTANIGTIATDLGGDDHIGTVAGSISNVNSVGGSIANVNTVATNLTSVNSFANVYRVGATDPTTSLDTGDLFYNTTSSQMKVYNGSAWESGVVAGSGFMPTTGGSFTGDVSFGDNDKAIFGAGSDLQIYHDGSNSYISDTAVGDLKLTSNGTNITFEKADGTDIFNVATSGATTAYYNGNPKLATTSTGVNITGTLTSDGLTVDGNATISSAAGSLYLEDNNYTSGQKVFGITSKSGDLFLRSFTDDKLTATNRFGIDHSTGDISFYEDTGTTAKFFWDASAESLGLGATSFAGETLRMERSGDMILGLFSGASSSTFLNMGTTSNRDAGQIGYTQSSNHMFFRVNDAERMRIASDGSVGIGNTNPTVKLDVQDTSGVIGRIQSTSGDAQLNIAVPNANDGIIAFGDASNYRASIKVNSSDAITFQTSSSLTERMRIDSSGNLLVGTTTSPSGSNKLFLAKGLVETTTTVSYASSIALTYNNGSIQTVTLTGNVTFTDSLADGEAIVLMLNGGASYTVTWTAVDKWVSSSGNAAPTLTANDTIVLWKIGTTVYAAYAGSFT